MLLLTPAVMRGSVLLDSVTGDADIRAALLALGSDERAVVVLRFYGDLSVAQVADVLAIPEGTVKTRTRTGLAALRESGIRGAGDLERAEEAR